MNNQCSGHLFVMSSKSFVEHSEAHTWSTDTDNMGQKAQQNDN